MQRKVDNNYISTTGSLVNRDDARYIRILWLSNDPDWDRIPIEQVIVRSKMVHYQEDPVLMLDNTTICLS